jgi:hypothetical protein
MMPDLDGMAYYTIKIQKPQLFRFITSKSERVDLQWKCADDYKTIWH